RAQPRAHGFDILTPERDVMDGAGALRAGEGALRVRRVANGVAADMDHRGVALIIDPGAIVGALHPRRRRHAHAEYVAEEGDGARHVLGANIDVVERDYRHRYLTHLSPARGTPARPRPYHDIP